MNKAVTPEQLSLERPAPVKAPVNPGDNPPVKPSPLAQAGPSHDDQDFDWSPENPDVVLRAQPATAIYYNAMGHIVIRQERAWSDECDPLVAITPENAVTFMEALAKRARE